MRKWMGAVALVTAMGLMPDAAAAVVEGMLELQWGDPSPQARKLDRRAPRFQAFLVTDDGRRFALDTDQALQAAENLHALSGRRIAVDFSAAGSGVSTYRVETIVPADDLHLAEARATMIEGTTVWATIMCKFADIPDEQKTLAFFQSQYGNSQGQLDHYWREVSYGKINLTGSSAHGWYTLPHPRSHYVPGSANLNALFDDCVSAADADVDFAANGGLQGINMMFNGELDGFAWGGGRCVTLDGINKCWSTTWNPPWSFNNLAPLAHEMGHGYGLPHANNSDGDGDPYDNPWDVMSSAWNNANSNPTYGAVAKHINVYHRRQMGWVTQARTLAVTAGEQHTAIQLDRASLAGGSAPQMILVRVPGEPSSRYYTVEARMRSGYYEANLAGNAVIIHAVNTSRSEPAWSVDSDVPPASLSNNEGSMFKPGETWTAPGNAFRVKVWAQNANGFVVSVCGPRPSGGGIGRRFDPCNIGPSDHLPRPR
jgi:M6 family metalloprotease-like protein